jgi:hypothetical protein
MVFCNHHESEPCFDTSTVIVRRMLRDRAAVRTLSWSCSMI